MSHQFKKHYTVEEARGLLPQIRQWLEQMRHLERTIEEDGATISLQLKSGADLGGDRVNRFVRSQGDYIELVIQFREREIQIKDLQRGLIDFPAIIGGKEVFLCWEQDEDDIEHWHDLDTGFQGREKLP
jgi:hypothetical protein